MTTTEATPTVFQAWAGVMRDVAPVAKGQQNKAQNYSFRGVDDVMSAMAGPLRNHGVFVIPELVEQRTERRGEKGTVVYLTMRYRVYGPAGDSFESVVPGEAMDFADKATNKAMSAAFKYFMFQSACIPVDSRSIDDGDRDHPVAEAPREHRVERQQRQQRQKRPNGKRQAEPSQAPGSQAPRRDYVAEAQAAPHVEAVRALYAEAQKAGAPADYLAQIADIGGSKPAAPGPTSSTPGSGTTGSAATERATEDEDDAAARELRAAAAAVGLDTIEADFEQSYGVPIDQARAAQLRQMTELLVAPAPYSLSDAASR